MALTLIAFAFPLLSVGACGCVGEACGQQPNQEGLEVRARQEREGNTDQIYDAELTIEASGWDIASGRVSTRATSHDTRLGSSALLQERATTTFADIQPIYAALMIPLIGLGGAALLMVRGAAGTVGRIVLGLVGAGATALVIDLAGDRVEGYVNDFGRDLGIVWVGDVRASLDAGGVALYVLFLLPLAHEVLLLAFNAGRTAWQRMRGSTPSADA